MIYSQEDSKRIQVLSTDIQNYAREKEANWMLNGGIENEWEDFKARLKQMGVDELVQIRQKYFDIFKQNQ